MKKLILILALFAGISAQLSAQTYCTPVSNCFYSPILSVVSTSALTNLSVTSSGCSPNGYAYYQNTFVSYPGDTIFVTIGLTGTLQTGGKVWVDWNSDGDFNDPGELLSQFQTSVTSFTDTIFVPANSTLGKKRLRVRSNYYNLPTDACSNQSYGETEDFNLTLVASSGTDIAMTAIDSPVVYKVGNNTLWIKYSNLAINNISSFDAGFSLNNGTPTTVTGISTSSAPGIEKTYKFTTSLNISSPGSHTLRVWVRNPNSIGPDIKVSNDTMVLNFCTGMAGTYTIGSGGNYASFAAAIAAMNSCGVAGPITFNVLAGTYNERVVMPKITGVSATNTVTFEGPSTGTATIKHTGNSSQRATLVFNGCEYITFKKLKIVNDGNPGIGVYFGEAANFNKVLDGEISVGSSGNVYGVLISYSEDGTKTSGVAPFKNEINNNTISNGTSGVYIKGTYPSAFINQNFIINNTFLNQSGSGIELFAVIRTYIQYNKIQSMANSNGNGISAQYSAGTIIDGNIIQPGTRGITLSYENFYYSDSTQITNNMISNFQNSSKQNGIYAYYDFLLRIYHNSIAVSGSLYDSTSSAICLWQTKGSSIMNNLLQSTGKTYLISLNTITSSVNAIIEYNVYYYPNSTNNKFYNYNKGYANLTTFKTDNNRIVFPHDVFSYDQKNPNFISSSNLHINSSSPTYNGLKIWVDKDADGDARCPFGSVIGADEGNYQGAKPVAGFSSDDSVCYSTPVVFVNKYMSSQSLGHKWYKDGVYMTNTTNFTFTFPSGTSTSTIKVVTTNCYGVDSFSKTIYIGAPTVKPVASFVAEKNIIAPFDEIKFFDGSINCPSTWEWRVSPAYFNDPYIGYVATHYFVNFTTKASQNPIIRFETPGEYDICMVVKNIKGGDSLCIKDYVIVKPIQYMCQYVLKEIELSPIGILTDDGGPQSNYGNNLNCDVKLIPCVDTLTFTFSEFELSAGDFLKVYDGKNNSGTPLWDMTAYGSNGLTGNMTNPDFKKKLVASTGTMFFNFTSNASNVNKGFIGEWFGVVSVGTKPVAKFTAPDTVCLNIPVYFQNLSTGDNLSYDWDFDGSGFTQSTLKDPNYTYAFPGLYPVKLTVSNCGGDTTFIKNVYVVSPSKAPKANFIANNLKPRKAIDVVSFTNSTTGCADTYVWDISPSSYTIVSDFPNGQNPKVIFNEVTCYTIRLIASYSGKKDTLTKTCYITPIDYCIPTINNLNTDLGISKVEIGSILNYSSIGSKAYTDFAATYSTYLDRYAWHIISIGRNTNKNAMTRKVWIDWNIDGDFNDPGEEVLYQASSTSITFTDTIRVPATASLGPTRMRIGTNVSGFSNTPCGPNLIGEYEDYRVIIRNYSIAPVVTLNGADTVAVEQCATFKDPGVTAISNLFGNISSTAVKTDNVDWKYPGTYWIKYTVTDTFKNSAFVMRYIVITPESKAPIVSLKGKDNDTVEVKSTYTDPGVNAYDSCSGVDKITIKGYVNTNFVGKYKLEYTVTDKIGNKSTIERKVFVADRQKPNISLIGYAVYMISVFSTFNDPGVTVNDNYDKNLNVVVTGSVNTSKIGTYKIKYSVSDSSGNGPVSVERIVEVIDDIKPVITAIYKDNDTIILDVKTKLSGLKVKASDNYDAVVSIDSFGSYYQNFTDGIATSLGLFTLIYKAQDKSGNDAYISFVIKVVDRIKPVLKLKGASVLNVCRFKTADTLDLLYSITDNFDQNPNVWISGTYYTQYLPKRYVGMFNLVYHAKDASGNLADSVVRYINVSECGSIGEKQGKEVKIYPNPNTGAFYLYNEKALNIERIDVFNGFGQKIEAEIIVDAVPNIYHVKLLNAAKGIYYVRIIGDFGAKSLRINVL